MKFISIVAIIIFMIWAIAGNVNLHDGQKSPPSPEGSFLAGDQRKIISAQIRARGFSCPEAKFAYPQGESARGFQLKIWCGPEGGNDVYPHAGFLVTGSEEGSYKIEPID